MPYAKDTINSKPFQVGYDLFVVLFRLDAETEDDWIWIIGQADQMRNAQTCISIHKQDVISLIDEWSDGVWPNTAWFVLQMKGELTIRTLWWNNHPACSQEQACHLFASISIVFPLIFICIPKSQ